MLIRRNRFHGRTSPPFYQRRPLLLCLMWSLPLGCGEDTPLPHDHTATPPTQTSDTRTETADDPSSQQDEQFAPLQTSSPAGAPQQHVASVDVEQTEPADDGAVVKTRLPDDRPDLNSARLAQAGIRQYESRRLVLLTDLPKDMVAHLPALADQLFDRLELHFGVLPPALDGSEFQVTGHLIRDQQKFREAGLMPSETFTFDHGRHWNYQFWMFDTKDDYYRRHLLFHEFTHCFMTCECGMQQLPASWYMEGMAEYFATHQLNRKEGRQSEMKSGVLPGTFEGFEGWGRISEIRRSFQPDRFADATDIRELKIATLDDVVPDKATNFTQYSQYATSWAACWFLQSHPDYQGLFRPLAKLRTEPEVAAAVRQLRDSVRPRLCIDWLLFVESLRENYDVERSFPVHSTTSITTDDLRSDVGIFQLQAALDWQDSGLRLRAGESVNVKCEGQFSVNDQPRRWMSEPQGVSVEYFSGLPLGQVVAALVSPDGKYISSRISVGTGTTISASRDVSVWLQVNDSSAGRSNNAGTVNVEFSLPPR